MPRRQMMQVDTSATRDPTLRGDTRHDGWQRVVETPRRGDSTRRKPAFENSAWRPGGGDYPDHIGAERSDQHSAGARREDSNGEVGKAQGKWPHRKRPTHNRTATKTRGERRRRQPDTTTPQPCQAVPHRTRSTEPTHSNPPANPFPHPTPRAHPTPGPAKRLNESKEQSTAAQDGHPHQPRSTRESAPQQRQDPSQERPDRPTPTDSPLAAHARPWSPKAR